MTTSPPAPRPAATTFTARTPEDLLAAVPVVLGFRPADSVVLVTTGASPPFHARVDLPRRGAPSLDAEVDALAATLLAPCRRHAVRRAVLVLYTEDAQLAAQVARATVRAFTAAGIDVVDTLRAHDGRWYVATGPRHGVPGHGVPYDVSAHPFAAQAVLEGRVTHGSREELRATLAEDPTAVAATVEALGVLPGGEPASEDELRWARETVRRHVAAGTVPSEEEVARLLVGMLDVPVRDAAWETMSRGEADRHVRFWTDVVRRCPPPLLAAPAALLAFAAWLAGHGALAWCALDRCEEAAPGYRLAGYLAHALTHAVPPSVWDGDGAA
ncbi:DUF4192 domain-containing protein [Nocardioides sp. SYSU DS0663]|uniref:DUF4192 domain-containing protein n=1 Tax=Nocardioides sp. SYSU DS0663 TaxID=3416445 RepID=UPI003F4B39AC